MILEKNRVDSLLKDIEWLKKDNEFLRDSNKEYIERSLRLLNEIEGLKKENEYLQDRLKEETERVDLTPGINISIGYISVTNYPESFLKED